MASSSGHPGWRGRFACWWRIKTCRIWSDTEPMAERKQDWAEAKKLCRLNQNDIEMAKRLGFHPRSLIRLRPDPKQKWKLPVKYWIHELHFKKFGHVIGEKEIQYKPPPLSPEEEAEEARS